MVQGIGGGASQEQQQQEQEQLQLQQVAEAELRVAEAVDEAVASVSLPPAPQTAVVAPLPDKNFGVLRGGRYPFLYDNVYGLPVVREVASYGEVLEGIRWVGGGLLGGSSHGVFPGPDKPCRRLVVQ